MYGLPWELDIFEELANPLEAGLDHGRRMAGCQGSMYVGQRAGSRRCVLKRTVTAFLQTVVESDCCVEEK